MSQIKLVEDMLIARIKALLGDHVRTVDWAPPDLDKEFLARALKAPPGVLVQFLGGARSNLSTDNSTVLNTMWAITAVTKHVQEPKARAQGDAREIGCYDILEILAPKLEVFDIPNIGTLELEGWSNELAMEFESSQLMLQSLTFSLDIALERNVDLSTLDDFETFTGTFDTDQLEGAPANEVVVTLPNPDAIVYASFLTDIEPPVGTGDVISADAVTSAGNAVKVYTDGRYSIEGDDGNLPSQHFEVNLFDTSEGAWHVQFPKLITVGQ